MKKIILLACCFSFIAISVKAQLCFEPTTTYPSQPSNTGVAAGDFNNDGHNDIATSSFSSSGGVSVFLNNGSGTFPLSTTLTSTAYCNQIEASDINQDGNLDLIVTSTYGSNLLVYIGDGFGGFAPYQSYLTGSIPFFFELADLNGDGKIDAATSNYSDGTVTVLINNGTGGFEAPVAYIVGDSPRGITISDFNMDGHKDISNANDGSSTLSILLNNGDGTFGAAEFLPTPSFSPSSISSGDFNNDGYNDVVTCINGNSQMFLFPGLGDGSFSAGILSGNAPASRSMESVDINNDGKLDIITTVSSGITVLVLLGNGDGTFTNTSTLTVGSLPYSVAIADFNNDAVPDLATANNISASAGSMSVILNSMPFVQISNISICSSGGSVTLSPTGALSYTISGGNFTVSPNVTTTYTITGTALSGCTNIKEVTVFVGLPSSSNQIVSLCYGEHLMVGSIMHDTSGIFIDTIPNSTGCDSVITSNLTIFDPTVVSILHPTAGNTHCYLDTDTLYAVGATNYLWNTSETNDTIIISYDYNIIIWRVAGTDSNGCVDTASIYVAGVAPAVNISIDFSSIDSTCVNYSAFPISSVTPPGGTWLGTGVIAGNFDPNSAGIGTHYLTYEALNVDNCPYTALDSIFVSGCVGLNEYDKNTSITIAPNPNNGTFTIKAPTNGNYNLVNELGQIIQSFELNNTNNYSVSMNDLATGVYFIIGTDNNFRSKIVVTK